MIVVQAAVLAALAGSMAPTPSPGTEEEVRGTSVVLVTDRLDPLPGVPVVLDDGRERRVVVTGSSGQSSWAQVDGSAGLTVTLGEAPVGEGIAVGMLEVVPPIGPDLGLDVALTFVERSQPVAVPVLLEGKAGEVAMVLPPEGDHPHWLLALPPDSPLRMSMHVALLMDAEAIGQHVAYRGHVLPGQDHVRAVACRTGPVDLGPEGVLLGIELHGDVAGSACVDAFLFVDGPLSGPPQFEVETLFTAGDRVHAELRGTLPGGWLVLAARPGSQGEVVQLEDRPPHIVVPPDSAEDEVLGAPAGDGGRRSGSVEPPALLAAVPPAAAPPLATPRLVSDCEPPVPAPALSCTVVNPPANACGAGIPYPIQVCKTIRSRTPTVCRSGGSGFDAQVAITASWKATFAMEAEVPFGFTKKKTAGGFEYGRSSLQVTTDSWTAEDGAHGLGQCMRYFRFELTCVQMFVNFMRRYYHQGGEWVAGPCELPFRSFSMCFDSSSSQSVCDRTP